MLVKAELGDEGGVFGSQQQGFASVLPLAFRGDVLEDVAAIGEGDSRCFKV